jgi:hypothetical protein
LVVILERSRLAVGFPLSLNGPLDECPWSSAGFDFEIDEAAFDVTNILEVARFRDRALANDQEARLRLAARSPALKGVTISRHCRLRYR